VLSLCEKKLKVNSHIYLFLTRRDYPRLLPLVKQYFTVKNVLVYETPGVRSSHSGFLQAYQFILFAHKGCRHLTGRRDSSVFRWTAKYPPGTHFTEKPLPLLAYLIEKSTLPGEVVCDPFAGTGAVGLAAKNTGRQFIGIEEHKKEYKEALTKLGL